MPLAVSSGDGGALPRGLHSGRGRHSSLRGRGDIGSGRGRLEYFPCASTILGHLRLQRFDAVEAAIRANKVDELHPDLAAIEVAVEVEQEHLEDGGAGVERRAVAEIGGGKV